MPAPVQELTIKKKKWWRYIPVLPILCFAFEVTSLGIWNTYSRAALSATRNSLAILGLNIDSALVWSAGALASTVALVVIFALCMLALGVGRAVIAYQADRTGATRMGGRLILWMWLDAIFIGLWFLVTLWLLILLLGQCLWMASAWGLNTSVQVGLVSAEANRAAGLNGTIPHLNSTAADCSLSCIDLYEFEWVLRNHTCFCNLTAVGPADTAMKAALAKMEGSVTGAVALLISGMAILMVAASEFGVTRRERQLLRRIAKARMAQSTEMSKLLPDGGGGSSGGGLVSMMSFKKKGKGGAGGEGGGGGQGGQTPQVLVDPETGEPIEVDGLLPDQPQTGANAAGGTGDKAGGKGGGGGLPDGLNRGSSLLKTAKYLGKGLAKTTKVFDALGSFMGPMGRK